MNDATSVDEPTTEWPDEGDPPIVVRVMCVTAGCENAGVVIALLTTPGARIFCGPCGAELARRA